MRRRVPPDSTRRRRVVQPLGTLPGCLPFVSSALQLSSFLVCSAYLQSRLTPTRCFRFLEP